MLLRQPTFGKFLPQFFVDGDEIRDSSRDTLIKFVVGPLLFGQKPGRLQSDRCLLRGNAQQQQFGLPREIRALRPGHNDPDFTMQAQSHGQDRHLAIANRVPYRRRPLLRRIVQQVFEGPANLRRADQRRVGCPILRSSDLDELGWRRAVLIAQSHIDEIQLKHPRQHIEYSRHDAARIGAMQDGRLFEEAEHVIDAALQAQDFLGRFLASCVHVMPSSVATQSTRVADRGAREATSWATPRPASAGGCRGRDRFWRCCYGTN